MAIIKMKRLRLLALRSDREELLHTLQRLGCVEISEPPEADGRSDAPPGDWEGPPGRPGAADAGRLRLGPGAGGEAVSGAALSVLARHGAKGRGMLTPRPS